VNAQQMIKHWCQLIQIEPIAISDCCIEITITFPPYSSSYVSIPIAMLITQKDKNGLPYTEGGFSNPPNHSDWVYDPIDVFPLHIKKFAQVILIMS